MPTALEIKYHLEKTAGLLDKAKAGVGLLTGSTARRAEELAAKASAKASRAGGISTSYNKAVGSGSFNTAVKNRANISGNKAFAAHENAIAQSAATKQNHTINQLLAQGIPQEQAMRKGLEVNRRVRYRANPIASVDKEVLAVKNETARLGSRSATIKSTLESRATRANAQASRMQSLSEDAKRATTKARGIAGAGAGTLAVGTYAGTRPEKPKKWYEV
jgi:hypothetical protein